ncbi:MAG: NAD(P)-dependent glycerol-3-phosphate dehydrogenase [Planctomycetes bacterium]|nr:NAD(P)-dependent glycerol-3-phosphate dehydrogenase [Planctomycetota bacterium]
MRIGVIGDGGWGTALALLLRGNGHSVRIWGAFPDYVAEMRRLRENRRFLPGVPLPEDLELTDDPAACCAGSDLLLSVVPTPFLRQVAGRFAPHASGVPIVSATKGLEKGTLARPTEILREVLGPAARIVVLSGPSHAEEVARGLPTTVVAASPRKEDAALVQGALRSERFRVYTNADPAGVEIGGALKNVIALAAGICDGLGFGDNAKAALLTRGIVEIARYGETRGARRETFAGLSGFGDLIVTCYSRHSRNRSVGERLARGESIAQVLGSTAMVPEGVFTARALGAGGTPVEMPITREVHAVLDGGKDPRRAVVDLMTRDPRPERDEESGPPPCGEGLPR